MARLPQTAGRRQPPCEEKGTSRGPADRPLHVAPIKPSPRRPRCIFPGRPDPGAPGSSELETDLRKTRLLPPVSFFKPHSMVPRTQFNDQKGFS